jgi:hypothetical protein
MTVKEIVKKYLEENGYDGLWDEEDCRCFLDADFFDNSMICNFSDCVSIHRAPVEG